MFYQSIIKYFIIANLKVKVQKD